ncbi:MAG: type II secretion system GspH family protein [Muribaculaceae bacterium]|nr:type II secretion system GspH family protein [Muribaculaceae bacterium]
MKRFNNAFTLAEMMVALGAVAILCAIILPMIYNMMPNKNVIMAKRSFYTIQTIVSELINDSACYPNKEYDENADRRRIGFDDGYGYASCSKWGGKENKDSITSEDRMKKFNTLFFNKLGIKPPTTAKEKVETDDGVQWFYLATANLQGAGGYYTLHVDVNGDAAPNCSDRSFGAVKECSDTSVNFDQYTVNIYVDGRTEIIGNWAIEAIDITNAITR